MKKCIALSVLLVCSLILVYGRTVYAVDKPPVSWKDFGIIPNGNQDQTVAIQKYLNETARLGGGQACLPSGSYIIKGYLTVPSGVVFSGTLSVPHTGILDKGTVLKAYGGRGSEDEPALLKLEQNSAVKGFTIVYPEQKLADVKPYPWTIHGEGLHNTVEDITLVNSYQGIRIGPEVNSLHMIRNVYGCVLRRGILVDNCVDIGRIENVHFNPHYWPRSGHDGAPAYDNKAGLNPDLEVAAYMQKNLEAFIFARSDWEYVLNTFVFGAKIGYHFISNKKKELSTACNGQFNGIGADMCQYGVLVDEAQPWGILISNGQFVGGEIRKGQAEDRVGVCTSPKFDGVLQLSNCTFWGWFTNVLRLDGKGFVSLSQGCIRNWSPKEPAIDIIGGRASITGVLFETFYPDDSVEGHRRYDNVAPDVMVGKNVKRVSITGNFSDKGVKITNKAGSRLTANDNE